MKEEKGHQVGSKLLDEYVLADVGKIWMGSYGSARGRQWVYGQYDDATLPVCVYLLERCGLPHPERADPVLVSRALTKMVRIDMAQCTGGEFKMTVHKQGSKVWRRRDNIQSIQFNRYWLLV